MKRCRLFSIVLLFSSLAWSGCGLLTFDDSDEMVTADKTVSPQNLQKVTAYLLEKVPAIRTEKSKLTAGGQKIKLTLSILNAPEPDHTKNDPDYKYHANYYWVYVNYRSPEKLVKYNTYLVHKDLNEIYYCDSDKDTFVKVN